LHGTGDNLSDELLAAILCHEMKWTFDQYLDNPLWFNRLLFVKMGIEGEHNAKLNKQN